MKYIIQRHNTTSRLIDLTIGNARREIHVSVPVFEGITTDYILEFTKEVLSRQPSFEKSPLLAMADSLIGKAIDIEETE